MGWSHSREAGKTLDKWIDHCVTVSGSQNVFVDEFGRRFFYELDRIEHEDGRITGEIVPMVGGRRSAFRIKSDGTVDLGPAVLIEVAK